MVKTTTKRITNARKVNARRTNGNRGLYDLSEREFRNKQGWSGSRYKGAFKYAEKQRTKRAKINANRDIAVNNARAQTVRAIGSAVAQNVGAAGGSIAASKAATPVSQSMTSLINGGVTQKETPGTDDKDKGNQNDVPMWRE